MEQPASTSFSPRLPTESAFPAGLAVFAVLAAHSSPVAQAGDPPGDCWGGALSADPLHCYILDQAHSAGVIEVAAVYEASRVLHVYLTQTDPVGDGVGAFFKEQATEFVERWPDRVSYDHPSYDACAAYERTNHEDCLLNIITFWEHSSRMLPYTTSYAKIIVRTGGGAEARKSIPGWAAHRQLWPETTTVSLEASETPGGFDVSGVDMTNFPPINCSRPIDIQMDDSCPRSQMHADLGMAGWRVNGNKGYVEVKAPPGQESNIETAREALLADYREATESDLVVSPVRHSYEEMWRWATIVNRFSLTSGNTMGIRLAFIGPNHRAALDRYEVVFPSPEVPGAELGALADYRNTINLMTTNLQPTVDALPQLLGQLNIPEDAVGMVIRYEEPPSGRGYPEAGLDSPPPGGVEAGGFPAGEILGEVMGDSPWLAAGVVSGLAAAVLGTAVLVTGRVRRRQG